MSLAQEYRGLSTGIPVSPAQEYIHTVAPAQEYCGPSTGILWPKDRDIVRPQHKNTVAPTLEYRIFGNLLFKNSTNCHKAKQKTTQSKAKQQSKAKAK